MSACECMEKINAQLASHNTRVAVSFVLDSPYVGAPWPILTSQIETGRGKPKAMGLFASYCPFCGVSLRKGGDA